MFFATHRDLKTDHDHKAAHAERGTDARGPYTWAFCAYCDQPYQDRGGKPICNRCYLGR